MKTGSIKYVGEIEAAIEEAADMSKVRGMETRAFDADGQHEILVVQTGTGSIMVRINAALTGGLPYSQKHQRAAIAIPVSGDDIADLLSGSLSWEMVQNIEGGKNKTFPWGVYSVEDIANRVVKYLELVD